MVRRWCEDWTTTSTSPTRVFLTDISCQNNFDDLESGVFTMNFLLGGGAVHFMHDATPPSETTRSNRRSSPVRCRWRSNATPPATACSSLRPVPTRSRKSACKAGGFRLEAVPGGVFETAEIPMGLAVNEDRNELYVVTYGGDRLEVFDLDNRQRLQSIDLAVSHGPVAIEQTG